MLYRANRNTKQICLRIQRNNMDDCCADVELQISPLVCEQPKEYVYCYSACGGMETKEKKREQPLTLVYDMFNTDENGKSCFLLDSQFADLPCGRYNATVVACGCNIFTFQIDKRETAQVSQITMDDRSNCCEGKYGC